MTYPPGSPGYPPAQQPTTQFAAPMQQHRMPDTGAPEGAGKLSVYLLAAVAVLGLAVYVANFGPMFTITSDFPQLGTATGSSLGLGLAVVAAILAGLLAAVSLLPKQKNFAAVVAAIAVAAFLLVIGEIINKPSAVSIGWALYLVIAFTVLQAAAAVGALLLDAGVISASAPRPKYEQQQQYGQYGPTGQYYGQPQGQPHPGGHRAQRPGYPSQYGSYPGGPSSGGFSTLGSQSGPPTPPTGFPAYGQPPTPPSGSSGSSQTPAPPQSSSSRESGQSSS